MKLLKQYLKGKLCIEIWETLRAVGKKSKYKTVYVIKQYTGAKLTGENTTTNKAKVDMFERKLKETGYK